MKNAKELHVKKIKSKIEIDHGKFFKILKVYNLFLYHKRMNTFKNLKNFFPLMYDGSDHADR